MTKISVEQLFIYPFKGLSAQRCDRVDLQIGHGIPGDRAFALMYDEQEGNHPLRSFPWMKKQHFIMQNDWSGLAALDCIYEPATGILRVKRKGIELLVADTASQVGRDRIAAFFTGYLAGIYPSQTARHPHRAPLQLVGEWPQTRYPDRDGTHISLVSQETINHLSELTGKTVDVRRFRPNIVLAGVPAWQEFTWVGRQVQLGTAQVMITARINRCLNIEVNPETGERDMTLLGVLQEHLQHKQTGVFAKVVSAGTVTLGDTL